MWKEARRREKATQKLLNEHKKRADKRREENRVDPNSLLHINGIKSKIHLEPTVYKQALKSLVAWQEDKRITIDRFDVRATLTSIPTASFSSRNQSVLDADESELMKKLLNFERNRLLIQNDLNRMPEESRLKLVANNDHLSDAKMRKLRNNKFGTSGESSVSSYSSQQLINHPNPVVIASQTCRKGTSVGFTYSSVPPPQSLTNAGDTTKIETINANKVQSVLDLDDYADILEDLDSTSNIVNFESKRLSEIARKYSITSDELLLIIETDKDDSHSFSTVKALYKYMKMKKNESEGETVVAEESDQVYGPALPPKLIVDNRIGKSSTSSEEDSPVGQRSPSAIIDVPFRSNESKDNSSHPSTPTYNNIQNSIIEDKSIMNNTTLFRSTDKYTTGIQEKTTQSSDENTNRSMSKPEPDLKHASNVRSSASKQYTYSSSSNSKREPRREKREDVDGRRASTPLLYKRNRRSSRSLSRERHKKSSRRSSSSSSSPSKHSNSSSSIIHYYYHSKRESRRQKTRGRSKNGSSTRDRSRSRTKSESTSTKRLRVSRSRERRR